MIDILIPVLARPERAEALVHNISKATKSRYHVLFICSLNDAAEIEACMKTGEDVMVMTHEAGPADFAKKINAGYRHTEGDFIQIGADDLIFHKGWDLEALAFKDTAGVIGTNDMHNPRVKRGVHSTHPLIAREYIEKWGGTFDGSGEVFCELYDHQYVDDELVQTAIMRHRWQFARNSLVEHRHPYFGGNEMDGTYEKALRRSREDHHLYMERYKVMRKQIPRERVRRRKERL